MCNPSPHFAANDRLVQRLQSSVCSSRVPLHGPVQFAISRGIRLVVHMFSPNLLLSFRGSSPHIMHCSSDQAHSSFQTASRSVQLYLHGSQMLCCTMYCHWGRKPPKLPLTLWISSTCRRRTEPWPIGHRQRA